MPIVILLFVFVMSFPAMAADDNAYTIKVIGDDGSVQVLDLRKKKSDVPAQGEAEPAAPPAAPEPAPQPANKAPVKDVVKSAPPPKASPAPKSKPVKKAKAVPQKIIPIPPRLPPQRRLQQPDVQQASVVGPVQPPPPSALSRGQAIAIALDYAPPSTDMEVYRHDYQGREVYAVMFKTEDGFHEVLLDPVRGTVLESRKSTAFTAQSRPGYLPFSLR